MRNARRTEIKDALNEALLLSRLRHPNVVRYHESFMDQEKVELCIIMEFAGGGDLTSRIDACAKSGRRMAEEVIWGYVIQMLEGLQYLHRRNMIHRDIKSANCFLTARGTLKLGDMNVSKVSGGLVKTQIGTPYNMAPEVWSGKAYDSKCDVWSAGVVAYELAALTQPFNGRSIDDLSRAVRAGAYRPIPATYTADLSEVIARMLQVSPGRRPTAAALLALPLLKRKRKELAEAAAADGLGGGRQGDDGTGGGSHQYHADAWLFADLGLTAAGVVPLSAADMITTSALPRGAIPLRDAGPQVAMHGKNAGLLQRLQYRAGGAAAAAASAAAINSVQQLQALLPSPRYGTLLPHAAAAALRSVEQAEKAPLSQPQPQIVAPKAQAQPLQQPPARQQRQPPDLQQQQLTPLPRQAGRGGQPLQQQQLPPSLQTPHFDQDDIVGLSSAADRDHGAVGPSSLDDADDPYIYAIPRPGPTRASAAALQTPQRNVSAAAAAAASEREDYDTPQSVAPRQQRQQQRRVSIQLEPGGVAVRARETGELHSGGEAAAGDGYTAEARLPPHPTVVVPHIRKRTAHELSQDNPFSEAAAAQRDRETAAPAAAAPASALGPLYRSYERKFAAAAAAVAALPPLPQMPGSKRPAQQQQEQRGSGGGSGVNRPPSADPRKLALQPQGPYYSADRRPEPLAAIRVSSPPPSPCAVAGGKAMGFPIASRAVNNGVVSSNNSRPASGARPVSGARPPLHAAQPGPLPQYRAVPSAPQRPDSAQSYDYQGVAAAAPPVRSEQQQQQQQQQAGDMSRWGGARPRLPPPLGGLRDVATPPRQRVPIQQQEQQRPQSRWQGTPQWWG